MKIYSINQTQYHNSVKKSNVRKTEDTAVSQVTQPSFKGNTGAAIGVFGGALLGAGFAALTIATGGLAGVVAAIGASGAIATGAAAGTHIGGITGSIIEDKLEGK